MMSSKFVRRTAAVIVSACFAVSMGAGFDSNAYAAASGETQIDAEAAVQEALDAITLESILGDNKDSNNIKNDLDLKSYTTDLGVEIAWSSGDPDFIAADGEVTRPEAGQASRTVTLRVTATGEDASANAGFQRYKEFQVTVLPKGQTQLEKDNAAIADMKVAIEAAELTTDEYYEDVDGWVPAVLEELGKLNTYGVDISMQYCWYDTKTDIVKFGVRLSKGRGTPVDVENQTMAVQNSADYQGVPQIYISDVIRGVYAGDKNLHVPVFIKNNTGFSSYQIKVSWEKGLKLIADPNTDPLYMGARTYLDYENEITKSSAIHLSYKDPGDSYISINYVSNVVTIGDGLLFTLVFDVDDDAQTGVNKINLELFGQDNTNFAIYKDGESTHTPVSFIPYYLPVSGLSPSTTHSLQYELPKTVVYDGTPKEVPVVPKAGVGEVTVFYEGAGETIYEKSDAAPKNAGTYTVMADVADAPGFLAADDLVLGVLTIAKAPAPTLEWPEPTLIEKGRKLKYVPLVGGSTEYGTFVWKNDEDRETPLEEGNMSFEAVFKPSRSTLRNYEPIPDITKTYVLQVGGMNLLNDEKYGSSNSLRIDWPLIEDYYYEGLLKDQPLVGGSTEYGTFAWGAGVVLDEPLDAGEYELPLVFTPSEETLEVFPAMENLKGTVEFTVIRKPLYDFEWPTPVPMPSNKRPSNEALVGGFTEYGEFSWYFESYEKDVSKNWETGPINVKFIPYESKAANYELSPMYTVIQAVFYDVPLWGDVTGDGKVTILDAQRALIVAMGIEEAKDEEFVALNLDQDDVITATDAFEIMLVALGTGYEPTGASDSVSGEAAAALNEAHEETVQQLFEGSVSHQEEVASLLNEAAAG
ncbi:MAG: hypothetical protein LBR44_01630 [Clostridiales Family XIII bacterium]|nr:hypothetical protein [Clostridiales Family XIII bacterium]